MNEPSRNVLPQHEVRDVNARAIGCFAFALVACIAAICVLIAGMFHRLDEHVSGTAANRIASSRVRMTEPQLQVDPGADMERFRARESGILNSYGWVNREAGVVRIPIERAMEIIAERGLPEPQGGGKTPVEMRQEKANAEERAQ